MKKLYTLGVTLSMVLFGTYSFAQIKSTDNALQYTKAIDNSSEQVNIKPIATTKDNDENVFFYEDFSNGIDGMGDNGAWTRGEAQGELWVKVYPVGSDNADAYNKDEPLFGGTHPLYGNKLPGYFSGDVGNSPTKDNGVMMVDYDRYNAIEDQAVAATLISPTIDLSDVPTTDLAIVFYERLRLCCDQGSAVTLDLSIDDGATWIPYNVFTPYGAVNNVIDREVVINITEVVENASDLSQVRLRFNAEGPQFSYYWFVDDISIRKIPDNDLVAKRTFTNNYIDYRKAFNDDSADDAVASNYYGGMEYLQDPIVATRSLNFAMEVVNEGLLTQTDVRLKVTGTAVESGATHEWISETGISIAPGEMDTVRIGGASLSDIEEIALGQYLFDYEVIQAELEEKPENNVGATRQYSVSQDIIRNDENTVSNSKYPWSSDVIWGNKYVFSEAEVEEGEGLYITHIETVFANIVSSSGPWAVTQPGEEVYFNVRQNDPFIGNDFVLFGTDNLEYEDEEITFTIEPEDIWAYGTSPTVWASFELPTPILVTPGVVYQAEYRVPYSQQDIVYPQLSSGVNMEPYAFTAYLFEEGEEGWYSLGSSSTDRWNGILMRFRTQVAVGVDKATVEDGVTLMQNYPNPFTDKTTIQFNVKESTKAKLEVRDITGKLVYSKDFGTVAAYVTERVELSKGSLAAGVYTYSIVTPESTVTRKLTIQ